MRARWFHDGQWRSDGAAAMGGQRSASLRRRHALDALMAKIGGPPTARDLAIFRLAWKLALQTARVRRGAKG